MGKVGSVMTSTATQHGGQETTIISTITQLLQTPPPKERYMGEPRALIIAPTRERRGALRCVAQAARRCAAAA